MSIREKADLQFKQWQETEAIAEKMIPLIGTLYRKFDCILSIYGREIINRGVLDIIKAHRFVRQIDGEELLVTDTLPILEALIELAPRPSRIDLGKLSVAFKHSSETDPTAFVQDALSSLGGDVEPLDEGQDVVLYGFGRIGRLLARIMVRKAGNGQRLRLRAIVIRSRGEGDLDKRASLLRRDSVHGPFMGTIQADEENQALIINGHLVKVIDASDPTQIDYTDYGIKNAILVDNTGRWRDDAGLGQHLQCPGIAKVVLTAPGKGDMKNIVQGINHTDISPDDKIISAASCTTNAITPVLKAINDEYGIVNGHVETVHSYTNDQNLIDNYHTGPRRGRSAALNMVITETGAAKAVAKALPELKGLLTGNAIRVPTPNVSLAILNLNLKKPAETEALNEYLRDVSLNSDLRKQIDFVNSRELVSTDIVGSRFAGIVDGQATISNASSCILYVWYDNEYGYSCQVVRVLEHMSGINMPVLT